MAKNPQDLIKEMQQDESFAKKVLADPDKFKDEYQLSDKTVQELKKLDFDSAVGKAAESAASGYYAIG